MFNHFDFSVITKIVKYNMAQASTSSSGDDLRHGNENEWELIGELIDIMNYPIETGFGFNAIAAKVTPVGIETKVPAKMTYPPFTLFEFTMEDRVVIPYKNRKATLFETDLSQIQETTIIYDLKMGRKTTKETINYLGYPTEVYKIDTAATRINIKNSTRAVKTLPWKFAYLPQSERYRKFSRLIHPNEPKNINNRYLSNYSSFSLINQKSLEALRIETRRYDDLNRRTFRPNFVIDAKIPYCEEKISGLKIGPLVEFGNIIPCTHTFTTINSKGEEEKDVLFDMLQRKHSVNVRYPREVASSWLPAFGINMEAVQTGDIKVGESVYAKFHNKASQ